jgi:predicted helicase
MSFHNHPAIIQYHTNLEALKARGHVSESQTRRVFGRLLETICDERKLLFVEEFPVGKNGRKKVDGAIQDEYSSLGYWEAKDQSDDLETEIKAKIALGYPLSNIIFEDTRQAILWQNQKQVGRFDLGKTDEVSQLLHSFFTHTQTDKEGFEEAVKAFVEKIPELARALLQKIEDESTNNKKFQQAFGRFFVTCQTALNPQIKESAVKEMLVQHLLTERLFKKVFQNEEWFSHNIIACEIESVIDALASRNWNRAGFLKALDPFFNIIEQRARTLPDYSSKQAFLNTVYERFFQGYSTETADTMGIVYTPQEIVDWMCASTERVLQTEFGKTLATPNVKILDPCTGTGNFIVNLLGRIPDVDLPHKYAHDLFANEIMLLPYYVASGNIEHEYFERMAEYSGFEGLCFADTLDLFQGAQASMFAEENTQRVAAEEAADLFVIIGNPPYNVGQKNENDNNKNRAYKKLDEAIRGSYAKQSKATNKNSLYDPYVRFFKWASERLNGRDGVICFVSNNSFLDQHAFDGMRQCLGAEFNHIWHLDLHGNVRKNPKLSGTTHNVFGIQVGVGITILARNSKSQERFIKYHRVPEDWRKTEKLDWLAETMDVTGVLWQELQPNAKNAWLTEGLEEDFESFMPLGTQAAKAGLNAEIKPIFETYGGGVKTNRDDWVYDFDRKTLKKDIKQFIDEYNNEVQRWQREGKDSLIDDFVSYEKIKWSRDLKLDLKRGHSAVFDEDKIRPAMYRPFCKKWLFFDSILNEEVYLQPKNFPLADSSNRVIVVSDVAARTEFSALMTDVIPDLHLCSSDAYQTFPLYTYSPDGSTRFDNITSYALKEARRLYGAAVSREDIFYATYALLHHPHYRAKYAENLKRELPRLPLLHCEPGALATGSAKPGGTREKAGRLRSRFAEYSRIGRLLGDLHVGYENATPFAFQILDTKPTGQKFSFRVEKMRFDKERSTLRVNDCITLTGFVPEMFEYRLGNRSALDWIVESYRVKVDARSGLVSDPNRPDEPKFILDLIGKVATVSLETQKLIGELPPCDPEA